jgi:putative FmdB family regulatory protein
MPIYEYACTACGERTEARQGFDDPPLETCPNCGGKLRKLYSPVGIVFKGSGFYSTDQKSKRSSDSGKESGKESGKDTKATKDTQKPSPSSDSGKSDSKSSSTPSTKEKSA